MDPRFQKTTFIPQKPIIPGTTRITHTSVTRKKESMGLLSLASIIVFVIAILVSVGAFSYTNYLTNRIQTLDKELSTLQASFDTNLIDELIDVDNRLKAARALLSQHLSVSAFFELLQSLTLQNVQFTDFSYETLPLDGDIAIFMKGKARNYTTLVLQSDILSQNKSVKRSVFSNLDLDPDGNVVFRLSLVFAAHDILYEDTFNTLSFDGFPY